MGVYGSIKVLIMAIPKGLVWIIHTHFIPQQFLSMENIIKMNIKDGPD